MPPKFRFTREEIICAATDVTRELGFSGLTARSLADRLGSSTKPVFGLFASMEEVQQAVLHAANTIYQGYVANAMACGEYPPYKASGMGYIRFAMEEPQLFRLLYMRDRRSEMLTEDRESIRPLLAMLESSLGLTEDEAYVFHLESWVYVHGLATMLATGYVPWDMDFISRSMTDMYQGLIHRFTQGGAPDGSHSDNRADKTV